MKADALVGFVFLALSMPARAESVPPAAQAQKEDEVESSLLLELNLFREDATLSLGGFVGVVGTTSGTAGKIFFVEPLALAGYQWDQNALLLGFSVLFQGQTTLLSLSPTYRHYCAPLRAGHFSPLFEGAVDLTTVNSGVPGTSLSWGLGLTVGAGGEWLFIRNLGIVVKVDLTYGHMDVHGSGSSSKYDSFSFGGTAGIAAHI